MKILIPVYPGFTALDAVGPYEVLSRVPGCSVEIVAERAGLVANDLGSVAIEATSSWHDHTTADAVVVPGGPGTRAALDSELPVWLAHLRPATRWMTSVCSGSLLLGASGVLKGLQATSHYRVAHRLAEFGARPVEQRVVIEAAAGVMTSAGVSAGIDMALHLATELTDPETAQAIQLWIEYNPEPPYSCGSPRRASPHVRRKAAALEFAARGPAATDSTSPQEDRCN